ncbi:Telomere repeat-binding protein 4 [Morus notabilis]|uniref:Telomere repeat-binding protein 4 n=1 Tax=Morus notabilis TaxID=981085 RepID=W9R2A7_9ROSA|nr:Telomere repeat-binding protein 4 [Morus notabilis]
MVLKKRLEYGFNGFQVPTIPRAPRSARRGSNKKKADDSQICAFELLASLAGQLLQECESASSASSNASEGNNQPAFGKDVITQERQDGDKLLKEECFEQGSSEESAFVSEINSPDIDQKFILKESPNAISEHISNKCDFLDKVNGDVKSIICNTKPRFQNYPSKVEGDCPLIEESCDANIGTGIEGQQKGENLETAGLTMANKCSSNDPMELQVEFPAVVNSDNDVKLPLPREPVPSASFSRHRNNIKLVGRDDEENFSRCNKPSNNIRAYKPPSRIGDRRIRKLLTSKYWKVGPNLKYCEVLKSDEGMKALYNKRKSCYNRDRCQHDTVYKRRKLFDRSSMVLSDGGFSSESVSNSPENGRKGDTSCSNGTIHGVKFSIKSFKIPELYIEVPETATVGSLKRTVMEAVTAILGGGLHVGVLFEGKKIRDDNRTLLQTGLSFKDNIDALGFTLEPNIMQAFPALCSEDQRPSLSCDTPEPLARSPVTPVVDTEISDALPELPPSVTNTETHALNNHETVCSQTDVLTDSTMPDSRALVVVPPVSVEALAVVPVNPENKKSELVQRRTRRPFSVSEVEALVQAVEELGTGRWRDVKLRAFEDADHRTYVDLKDKWKTLVHTATISPQQRRGEPVPQELLDRVLAAHAYWSQHQAKQHGKPQSGTLKIAQAPTDKHGVEGSKRLFYIDDGDAYLV